MPALADDIDFGVLLDDDTTWREFAVAATASCRRLGLHTDCFERHEFITASHTAMGRWPLNLLRNRMRDELRVDLVAYRR